MSLLTVFEVMYRKESAIPQEVMYLGTAADGSSCPAGNWFVWRSSQSDFVDETLGFFDIKGRLGNERFLGSCPGHRFTRSDKGPLR